MQFLNDDFFSLDKFFYWHYCWSQNIDCWLYCSPLHVIVLDELDAICKPRGRDVNNLGSLVYDSLVNQLLTKLDGLRYVPLFILVCHSDRRSPCEALTCCSWNS